MRFVRPVLTAIGVGAGLSLLLILGQLQLGWSSSLRMFVGGGLIVVGSMLTSGGSSRFLYEKGDVRRIDEADIKDYVTTRRSNVSSGLRLFIVGAAVLLSYIVV